MTYGLGTRSFNRSPEKREIDRQRAEATANYVPQSVTIGPICTCRSFEKPHELSEHRRLTGEMDWRHWKQREFQR